MTIIIPISGLTTIPSHIPVFRGPSTHLSKLLNKKCDSQDNQGKTSYLSSIRAVSQHLVETQGQTAIDHNYGNLSLFLSQVIKDTSISIKN